VLRTEDKVIRVAEGFSALRIQTHTRLCLCAKHFDYVDPRCSVHSTEDEVVRVASTKSTC
jgi:hypothetical protein